AVVVGSLLYLVPAGNAVPDFDWTNAISELFSSAAVVLQHAESSRAMRNQVLGVGDHDGCRLRAHFLPALRLQFANERRVDGSGVRAVAFSPRFGGRV